MPSGEAWKGKHASMRAKLEAVGEKWSSTHSLKGITTERGKDVVDLCHEITKDDAMVVDISQDASRLPWAKRVRSIVKNSELYSFSKDRTLHGVEHLRLLGFPTQKLNIPLTASELKDVSGEAMAVPAIGLVTFCLLHSVAFPDALWDEGE